MGFMLGEIMDTTDAGEFQGIHREIACECWFTSTGTTMPRFIKVMDEKNEILKIQVLEVLSSDVKRFSGIETVEYICKIGINNRTKIVKLILDKMSCRWKMIFL